MTRLVDVVSEDARWEAFGLCALAESAARVALGHLGHDPSAFEIALLGADAARVAELNGAYRGKDAPTNVLSWPAVEWPPRPEGAPPPRPAPGELGDVALSWETCMAEATAAGLAPEAHVTHLVVHGCLHLLGYDHVRDGDATLMEGIEAEILGKLGIADPYS